MAQCCADGCDRAGRGPYCTMHYQRLRRIGKLTTNQQHRPHRPRPPKCTAAGCGNKVQARELCTHHYSRSTWRTPEVSRARTAERRALKLAAAAGDPTLLREYRQILAKDPCAYCGEFADQEDHIVALAVGGSESWDNLTSACGRCNREKHAKSLLEFMLSRG